MFALIGVVVTGIFVCCRYRKNTRSESCIAKLANAQKRKCTIMVNKVWNKWTNIANLILRSFSEWWKLLSENSGPAFDEFLDLLGQRVRLKGFEKYRAQLDNKCKNFYSALFMFSTWKLNHFLFDSFLFTADSTGLYSLYTTFHDYEIMFHVSTMLPFTPSNKQQVT